MIARKRFDTPCRIEVEHSDEFLCAHVHLAGGVALEPGDSVHVHGEPIHVDFGQRRSFDRIATVERAGLVERLWTKFAGHFEMTELYEVSFSPRSLT
ncbi:hypothetical protein [Sphingomonas sp. 37zxx]|uniref:hypothetical protein n=1 Tax=Sphingomonas sp. 37zxx TaxID=1550073 RepID=UPI00053BE198|nr:hypothetical protein [Sphingomonas sp. 37zxx]